MECHQSLQYMFILFLWSLYFSRIIQIFQNNIEIMQGSQTTTPARKKLNPADKLRSRLFEKGISHSSMSLFRPPVLSDYSNKMLLVNLNSANSSKFSPKIIRKQVAGLPNQGLKLMTKNNKQKTHQGDRIKTISHQKSWSKQSQFLQEIAQQLQKSPKSQTASHFYNSMPQSFDQVQQPMSPGSQLQQSQFRRTKQLVDRLTGRSRVAIRNDKLCISPTISPHKQKLESSVHSPKQNTSQKVKTEYKCEDQDQISLESYIKRALRNESGLQQFLYLINSRGEADKKQEDPYQLFVVQYNNNKDLESKLNDKYYTVSKKGLCYYVNSKPVEFIELEDWMAEKQIYQKIKTLKFFKQFRKWRTVKKWRQIVLRHFVQECSKNLQDKLFFLNGTMRQCLFQIQELNLDLGQNFVILASNQDGYSLQNFKSVQENNKRKISAIIQQTSSKSRIAVKKCFDENLKSLKQCIKQKEKDEPQDKIPSMMSHINLKDSAFQALGFPPKMSYQNRSQLRKMAAKFIRFSYLVDMIHTAGLALHFRNQLTSFITKIEESQLSEKLEILMTAQDGKNQNSLPPENPKIFNIKLHLHESTLDPTSFQQIPFISQQSEAVQIFNPVYHLKDQNCSIQENLALYRKYCPTICDQWLSMSPTFEQIFKQFTAKIKQSLQCLKFFQRWSKHRDTQKFINILQEWDDVVSDSREIAQNQNLDPSTIIPNFENSLIQIRAILSRSLQYIHLKIKQEFTEFLNVYYEQQKIDLKKFRSPTLQSPPQMVQQFLKYITNSINEIDKKIPYRIKLGVFEINLTQIRVQLMREAEEIYEKFKQMLPEVVEQRTSFVNSWLTQYNEAINVEINGIDKFVQRVHCIKQIQQTFEKKKQLCFNLASINQIMEIYKINTIKKKELEAIIKLRDQLDSKITSFQQSFPKQADNYSKEVYKTYLPSIVKDISKLSTALTNQKYISISKNEKNIAGVIRQIEQLQKRYKDIAKRKAKCIEYQETLNQCNGIDQQILKVAKAAISSDKCEKINSSNNEIPSYLQQLLVARDSIQCLKLMWEKYQKWTSLYNKYHGASVKTILEDKDELKKCLMEERDFIDNRLKKILGNNQVIVELNKKVLVFQKYLPVMIGLNNNLSDTHWQQVNELAQKSGCAITLEKQKLQTLTLSEMMTHCLGEFRQEFEQIFVKAENQIRLQQQYDEMQKKFKAAVVKTKSEGLKYHVILDEAENRAIMQLLNEALDTITTIFANPYSIRLRLGMLTVESILNILQVYKRWLVVQRKLVNFESICKSIDLKKLSEGNLLQSSEKQYKSVFKILISRNQENQFQLIKLQPIANSSMNIQEKLQQCDKMLTSLEKNITSMLQDYRKSYPLFYELNDTQLLKVLMEFGSGQPSASVIGSVVQELICARFMEGIINEVRIEGQRILGVYTIDGQDVLKSPIALTSNDLESILKQIMSGVSEYCRKSMRACRNKSLQSSILQTTDQFNIQFLLAISKVDFSNYTSISIQNLQQNKESLKQYLKIMSKDTRNAIKRLHQKKSSKNILSYQSVILQNLIHEKILKQLIVNGIKCANQYNWIKYVRFYWEEFNGGNGGMGATGFNNAMMSTGLSNMGAIGDKGEDMNIIVKKMHISLRYGRQYVGSKAKVMIQNSVSCSSSTTTNAEFDNLDVVMSIVRNSQSYCYLGSMHRLQNFIHSIGHRLYVIKCNKEMRAQFGNPIKPLLKSRQGYDCCYFIQDAHLLPEQSMKSLLNLFPAYQPLSLSEPCPSTYNPIFLQFPRNQSNWLQINRQEYRNITLISPNNQFLTCYLYLMSEIINQYACRHQSNLINGNVNVNGNVKVNGNFDGKVKSKKSQCVENDAMVVSPIQTIMVLRKVFDVVGQLETVENKTGIGLTLFLQHCKNKISGIINKKGQSTPLVSETDAKQEIEHQKQIQKVQKTELHKYLMKQLLEYLQPLIKTDTFMMIKQYILLALQKWQQKQVEKDVKKNRSSFKKQSSILNINFQKCMVESDNSSKSLISKTNLHAKNIVRVNVVTGFNDCLRNYQNICQDLSDHLEQDNVHSNCQNQSKFDVIDSISLAQFTRQQLYGFDSNKGILHQIIHPYQTARKRKLIIHGIDLDLITYLSAYILESEEKNFPTPKPSSPNPSTILQSILTKFSTSSAPSSNMQSSAHTSQLGIFRNNTYRNWKSMNQFEQIQNGDQLQVQIRINSIAQWIDPKLLTIFHIQNVGASWSYVHGRVKAWIHNVCFQYREQSKKCQIFKICVWKFYNVAIKSVWKEFYKMSEQPLPSQTQIQQPSQQIINILRDFLNFLSTLIADIFAPHNFTDLESEICCHMFHKTIIHACIYALCYVYQHYYSIDMGTQYFKLEAILDKMQAEGCLHIPELQRIKPDQYQPPRQKMQMFSRKAKKRYTFFDYIFNGIELVPLPQYLKTCPKQRTLQRGELLLTDTFLHLTLITQRTISCSQPLAVHLTGPQNSGKSTFCRVYRSRFNNGVAYININAFRKNKQEVYDKMGKVLSLKNCGVIGAKANFGKALVFVDDLAMECNSNSIGQKSRIEQVVLSLASIIYNKSIITPHSNNKYRLTSTSFVIISSSNPTNLTTDSSSNSLMMNHLSHCTIKHILPDPTIPESDTNLRRIFTQIFKANVLDPEIQENIVSSYVQVLFDIYENLRVANQKDNNNWVDGLINFGILKRMALFTSHLRFKQTTPSHVQINRFWAYLLKDNFQSICQRYNVKLTNLPSFPSNLPPPPPKTLPDYLHTPTRSLLYTHLFIKQQVYGNGKEVEHIKQLSQLQNSINLAIEEYNRSQTNHRYGYSFQFIMIDELLVKIVKVSNMLVLGDYLAFGRKGMEVDVVVRLVCYLQGFLWKDVSTQGKIVDVVRETVQELTNVSLYLISVKIDDCNFQQFISYYDADFEAEITGHLQGSNLHSIQATGAFDFGIRSIQPFHQIQTSKPQPQPLTQIRQSPPKLPHKAQMNGTQNLQHKLSTIEQPRYQKLSPVQIQKIKRSIRLVFSIESSKYLKKDSQKAIPSNILSQLNVDFFEEYPRQSLYRYSEDAARTNSNDDQVIQTEVIQMIQNVKDTDGVLMDVYEDVRQQLGLTLKEFDECNRLYWSLVGNCFNDVKTNIAKYQLIFDMTNKLNQIISEIANRMEQKWEQKKSLTMKISQLKQSQYQEDPSSTPPSAQSVAQSLSQHESKLLQLNQNLQEQTQKRSLCEKITGFFKPTLQEYTKRHKMMQQYLTNNQKKLKIFCLLNASYFTYLSKLPHCQRKSFFQRWYQKCNTLKGTPVQDRIVSVSEFFEGLSQEFFVVDDKNQEYYENLNIVMNSYKPVLIRDDQGLGRKWIQSFDDSFASVCEGAPDFNYKLGEYLNKGCNIFLQITNQQTLNNSQTNMIHSLIFLQDSTQSIKIADTEYPVSSKTKIFIVVAPHIKIPKQIMSEHLYIVYEEGQQKYLKQIQHEIMLMCDPEKYTQFLEYKKKQDMLINQCLSLELPLSNRVFGEIYGYGTEEDDGQNKSKIKTKEELLKQIQTLSKSGFFDRMQQKLDRYYAKKKMLEDIKQKIWNLNLAADYNKPQQLSQPNNALYKIMSSISQTYCILQKLKVYHRQLPTCFQYYCTIKEGIKQNLFPIMLGEENSYSCPQTSRNETNEAEISLANIDIFKHREYRYNLGAFVMFVLRQWGNKLDQDWSFIIQLCLAVVLENVANNYQKYERGWAMTEVKKFVSAIECTQTKNGTHWTQNYLQNPILSRFLQKLSKQLHQNHLQYKQQSIQKLISQLIEYSIHPKHYQQILNQNRLPYDHNTPTNTNQPNITIIGSLLSNNLCNGGNQTKGNKLDSYLIQPYSFLGNYLSNSGAIVMRRLLKNVVVFCGRVDEGKANQDVKDGLNFNLVKGFAVRSVIERLLQAQSNPFVQIKNVQNVENQIKKCLNDKTHIYLPILEKRSIKILEQTLGQLSAKLQKPSTNNMEQSRQNRNQPMHQSLVNSLAPSFEKSSDKFFEDLKIYIYVEQVNSEKNKENNLDIIINILAKYFCVERELLTETVFLRNVSNSMTVLSGVVGFLKTKCDVSLRQSHRENNQEEQQQSHVKFSQNSQPQSIAHNATKNIVIRTKKQLSNHVEQKSKDKSKQQQKQKEKKIGVIGAPSMRNLQQDSTGHLITPAQVDQTPNIQKSNRLAQQQNPQPLSVPSPSSHFSSSTLQVHKIVTLILSYFQRIISIKTGKIDYGNNYGSTTSNSSSISVNANLFNGFFVNGRYFCGIEKCIQAIATENQGWNFAKTIGTICRIIANYFSNSSTLFIRDHIYKLLLKIVAKIEESPRGMNQLASTQKLRGLSRKQIQQNLPNMSLGYKQTSGCGNTSQLCQSANTYGNSIKEEILTPGQAQMQRVYDIIKKLIEEDLNQVSFTSKASGSMVQSCIKVAQEDAQILAFEGKVLKILRSALGLTLVSSSIYDINSSNNSTIFSQTSSPQQSPQLSRISKGQSGSKSSSSNRRSRNMQQFQQQLGLITKQRNSKPTSNFKRDSLNVKQNNDVIVENQRLDASQQNTANCGLGSNCNIGAFKLTHYLMQRDAKIISIKAALLKISIDDMGKEVNKWVQSGAKNQQYESSINAIYNLVMFKMGGLLPANLRSFIKQSLPQSQSSTLKQNLSSLTSLKNQLQRQARKIKQYNQSVDLSLTSQPIRILKAYYCSQFEQRVAKKLYGIGEDQINEKQRTEQGQLQGHTQHHSASQMQRKQDVNNNKIYYSVAVGLTPEQVRKQGWIKLSNVYALGWKLGNEGTYQTTQEDKVTILSNMYICKRSKPQQMGVCEIMLYESEDKKSEYIKLYAFTKKNQGQKIGAKPAYLKMPRIQE